MRDEADEWCHEDTNMAGIFENYNHSRYDEEEVKRKRGEKEKYQVEFKRLSDASYTMSGDKRKLEKQEKIENMNSSIMKGDEKEVDQEVYKISNEAKTTTGADKRCDKQDEKENNVNFSTMKGDEKEIDQEVFGVSSAATNTMDKDKTRCDKQDEKEKNVNFLTAITLEPVLFIHNICSQVVWIASQDLMTDKACSVSTRTELISSNFVSFNNYNFLKREPDMYVYAANDYLIT